MRRQSILVLFAFCCLMFGTPGAVFAQSLGGAHASDAEIVVVDPRLEPDYGVASLTAYTVSILDFKPELQAVTWGMSATTPGGIQMYQTSTTPYDWWAPVLIPSGARVTLIELEACDTTATGAIVFGMARGVSPAGAAANVSPVGTTGVAPTPGCNYFGLNLTAPITIDNFNNLYWLFIAWNGSFNTTLRANSIRVYYNLQVSPAPATATFNDVPTTHPFFQYVQALVASGITAGCGGESYCPDAPVTRGQMAVFLSRALGLHWAP